MNAKRILFAALVSAFLVSPTLLVAHPQQESVAEAARRAQASKKPAAKPAIVITNDDLETVKGTVSVVGEIQAPLVDQTAAAPDKAKTPAADDKSKAPAADDKTKAASGDEKSTPAKDETYWKKAFADARKKLADDAHELDVLQREYNLKQQQYYSDPNTAMKEQFNRQDLTDTKTKIDEKTAAVAQDKQAISDLEDTLRQAGGEPGWSNP
jgi:anion-transporting  ArsA/GET3 family ATPase